MPHNSICVYDSTDSYTNWGVNVSNDGGQNESPTLMNYNDIFSPSAQKVVGNFGVQVPIIVTPFQMQNKVMILQN
ncbi:MAG: hypothetical protein IPP71_22330 [Bacteroidetes bacterium]|nr:hypothetical protein [Bacteroidota bacterium]